MKEIVKEQIIKDVKYQSDDGKIFDTLDECKIWETYHGKTLYDILKDKIVGDKEFIEGLKNNIFIANKYFISHSISRDEFSYIKMITNIPKSFYSGCTHGEGFYFVDPENPVEITYIGPINYLVSDIKDSIDSISEYIQDLKKNIENSNIAFSLLQNETNLNYIKCNFMSDYEILSKTEKFEQLIKDMEYVYNCIQRVKNGGLTNERNC